MAANPFAPHFELTNGWLATPLARYCKPFFCLHSWPQQDLPDALFLMTRLNVASGGLGPGRGPRRATGDALLDEEDGMKMETSAVYFMSCKCCESRPPPTASGNFRSCNSVEHPATAFNSATSFFVRNGLLQGPPREEFGFLDHWWAAMRASVARAAPLPIMLGTKTRYWKPRQPAFRKAGCFGPGICNVLSLVSESTVLPM